MALLIITSISIFLLIFIINNSKSNNSNNNNGKKLKSEYDINYSKFYKKDFVMTPTELNFYKKLKIITDRLDLTIFPQVDLERIVNVYNNENSYRNRIKSRCIDFTIVTNNNCKIICCIELDDYTHNRPDRQKRDKFINELFQNINLKLYRIKINNYNMLEIEENIKNII